MSQHQRFQPADVAAARQMSRQEAVAYHYDNDTRFFSLWLDPTLSYSAARWHDPVTGAKHAETLEDAQADKIRHHLRASGIAPGGTLLDIGCGWGAVLERAVAEYGAARALGLTLSHEQRDHIAATMPAGVDVALEDAFAFESETPFDAAISIGAFEHFAKPEMSQEEKIAHYRLFFERLAALLKPGARFSLQTIVWDAVTFEQSRIPGVLPEHVFPQSDIPFVSEIVQASEAPFRLVYAENTPEDYAATLTVWIDRLKAQREAIVAGWGEDKFAFFLHYLRSSRLAFTRRKNTLARFVFLRR